MLMKEISFFETKIKECENGDKATIAMLKDEIKGFKCRLNQYFHDLSQNEGDNYFDQYLKTKDNLLSWGIELENKIEREDIQVKSLTDNANKKISVNLPKLEIPPFYGNKEMWLSFREIFKSSILENKTLNDVEKLQYLQSCVKGDASKLIRGFPVTSENLKNCWEVLLERYENRRLLAITQINKICNLKISKANSAKSLLELIDVANEVVRNLKTLDLPTNELSELMIINSLISKVDDPVHQRWELTMENNSIPTLDEFRVFIEKEARSLDDSKTSKPEVKRAFPKPFGAIKKSTVNLNTHKQVAHNSGDSKMKNCILCQQDHSLFKCPTFNSMTVHERWNVVREKQLCENCLRQNHKIETCKINYSCKNCQSRHHTLLHIYSVPPTDSAPQSIVTLSKSVRENDDQQVLLSTANIRIKSASGKFITCRALLDSASQNCLISKSCAEKLNLHQKPTSHRLIGINNTYAETSLSHTTFSFSPHFSAEMFTVDALVVSKVTTALPNFKLKIEHWKHLNYLTLADPSYYREGDIDILLGADIFVSLITGPPILGPKGSPNALPTKLGHILSGQVTTQSSPTSSISCHAVVEESLQKFWELEAVPQPTKLKEEDKLCEEIYVNSHKRNSEGRYIVKLPFVNDHALGDSETGALKRFYSLEKRLLSDDKLKEKYSEFMKEYELLGHMTHVKPNMLVPNYFLPHFGVINENSSTTRLRVVFDASFKTTSGKSLNDVLLTGEKLQSSIFDILLTFRTFKVGFSADIAKMYRQILIADEDSAYQQIFWRKSPHEPIKVFKLKTVTYGTSSAPYLAIRTLKQLCLDEQENFPNASEFAMNHFYVDDLLGGAESVEAAKALIQELQKLMSAGGFELRKWASSHPEVLAAMPDELRVSSLSYSLDAKSSQNILGLCWNLTEDAFQIKTVPENDIATKRQLLSVIARIFDPVGFISPSTIILKILLQEIWRANLEWDDELPKEILEKWLKFKSEIPYLANIKIPRYLHTHNLTICEIHGFCDASSKAFAAVIYLRIVSTTTTISLLTSKTRVAPVKTVTLPRLELCGALLLAELTETVQRALKLPFSNIYLWCDSTITLSWIKQPPVKGNQFVQHRVSKIHQLTSKSSWNHIPGKSNPVDCATRGLNPKQLYLNEEWFTGPKWLYDFDSESMSPQSDLKQSSEIIPNISSESLTSVSLTTQSSLATDLLEKFSSNTKIIRIVAWILRFLHNLKVNQKSKGHLQVPELIRAEQTVIKLLQTSAYAAEIQLIKSKKPLPKSSKLLTLNPFIDSDGILRVGGRLRHHPDLAESQKHPALIPKSHQFTKNLIRQTHETNMHAGQELVLSLIRQRFWIPDGKSTVRKELRSCITCFKFNARAVNQKMGDLPPARISPCRAFQRVGLDFAGPIMTKCQHTRKSSLFKSYICVFVCMCTKAIHLDLVSSLTSAAFLATLRRFVARRGYPTDIYSDNGSNFVGASSYLKALFKLPHESDVQDYTSQRAIQWHFIPPYAPNFGGLWESSVKLTKSHLVKTCKAASFTFEETSTLLCQIEAIVNSRPLYPLSPDPRDLRALTPGHFLIGCPLLELPEPSSNSISLSFNSRWKLLLQMKEKFWRTWSVDYLHLLQTRPKWHRGNIQIKPGQLVLIKDKSAPSTVWTMGRVTKVHPGADGICRVVTVHTTRGLMKRPMNSIALLPVPPSELDSSRPRENVD